ncbi:hypothetical protein [Pseudohongiella spirulinae]|uniref:Uncharacterized protein n=1 Tax=Pseudohongiella spirulinae TaxID=1249552 RepID=A0A0S2KHH2_9GAMM|nr:hypothetical protein [Pseudohongiella spirulinae]ALO47571.1 hypothetical protein PS2015_2944 [Pseudohongiella spirulinae]
MTHKRIVWLFAACLLMTLTPLQAQETSSDDQTDQTEQSSESNQESAADNDADRPDIDSQPIQRAEGEAPGRFIPSEQISQDLGVSFPVDI